MGKENGQSSQSAKRTRYSHPNSCKMTLKFEYNFSCFTLTDTHCLRLLNLLHILANQMDKHQRRDICHDTQMSALPQVRYLYRLDLSLIDFSMMY